MQLLGKDGQAQDKSVYDGNISSIDAFKIKGGVTFS
jgi:hypothetical protein